MRGLNDEERPTKERQSHLSLISIYLDLDLLVTLLVIQKLNCCDRMMQSTPASLVINNYWSLE